MRFGYQQTDTPYFMCLLYTEGKGLRVFLVAKYLQTDILVNNDVKFKTQR